MISVVGSWLNRVEAVRERGEAVHVGVELDSILSE